jgi:hypothetical protein
VIQEAYVQGVSTRSVDDLVQAMGMSGISKSQVSRLCGEIDERMNAVLDRPLEGEWPYVWLDATDVKVRQAGRIVSVAVIIAVGVNDNGRREVLGMTVGASEAETFWTEFLRSLARRGRCGVKLVISDAHEGLKAAIARVLHATWHAAAYTRSERNRPFGSPTGWLHSGAGPCSGMTWQISKRSSCTRMRSITSCKTVCLSANEALSSRLLMRSQNAARSLSTVWARRCWWRSVCC